MQLGSGGLGFVGFLALEQLTEPLCFHERAVPRIHLKDVPKRPTEDEQLQLQAGHCSCG